MHNLPVQEISDISERYKTWIKIVLILILAMILTFIVIKIIRGLKRPANATYVEGGGPIPVGWDAGPMTDNLFKIIDGTFVLTDTMQDAFGKFNELNDNQVIAVYNDWLDKKYDQAKKYFLFPYGTLTNAIKNKIGYIAFGTNEKQKAEDTLDRLHLP